jgi:hypothetical protein
MIHRFPAIQRESPPSAYFDAYAVWSPRRPPAGLDPPGAVPFDWASPDLCFAFLLDDPKIQADVEDLCKQANGVIGDIMFLEKQPAMMNDPPVVRDVLERSQRLGATKLDLPNRHLEELPQRFTQFLRLTDFLK